MVAYFETRQGEKRSHSPQLAPPPLADEVPSAHEVRRVASALADGEYFQRSPTARRGQRYGGQVWFQKKQHKWLKLFFYHY